MSGESLASALFMNGWTVSPPHQCVISDRQPEISEVKHTAWRRGVLCISTLTIQDKADDLEKTQEDRSPTLTVSLSLSEPQLIQYVPI